MNVFEPPKYGHRPTGLALIAHATRVALGIIGVAGAIAIVIATFAASGALGASVALGAGLVLVSLGINLALVRAVSKRLRRYYAGAFVAGYLAKFGLFAILMWFASQAPWFQGIGVAVAFLVAEVTAIASLAGVITRNRMGSLR